MYVRIYLSVQFALMHSSALRALECIFVRGATSDDSTRNSGSSDEGVSDERTDNYKDWGTLKDTHRIKTL